MAAPPPSTGGPITSKRQLVEYLAAGSKPASAWRIGTEHEKFVFRRSDLRTVPYDSPDGIRALLEGMTRFGWQPLLENGKPIALGRDKVSISLEPVATALFAASPFVEGKNTGYQSYRSHVWTDVDPDRSGILPFVFEPGFGFERYVDYLLDVPMYFVYRDGAYIDAAGQSFRDFIARRLPALPDEVP